MTVGSGEECTLSGVRFRFAALLAACALALGILLQIPNQIHESDPRYRGVPIPLNSDEPIYWARVQEGIDGRPEQSGEAMIGDPALVGMQPSLLERVIGTVLQGSEVRAADILQITDSIIPPLLFLTLWLFLRLAGFSRMQALTGALLFCVLELYNLNRPLYQRTSFLLTLLALSGVVIGARGIIATAALERGREIGTRGRIAAAIGGGILLGLLIGIYFWAWTFAWAFWGIFLAWEFIEFFRKRANAVKYLMLAGSMGIITALPFLLTMLRASRHPAYADAVFRSGIHASHLPESWIYSGVFLCIGVFLLILIASRAESARHYKPAIVFALAAVIAANQQMIHGRVFMFVSHYLFALIAAAIIVLLLAWALRDARRLLVVPALAALLYLAGIGWDGRHVLRQFTAEAGKFGDQHLAGAIATLDGLSPARVLTDPHTALLVAGLTHHNIVSAIYLKNILITHDEMAQRFCVTQLPVVPRARRIAEQEHLLWPDANSGYHNDPAIRAREVAIVEAACRRIDAAPAKALKTYGVDYVLWNKEEPPRWNVARLRVPLRTIATGSGWTLWSVH